MRVFGDPGEIIKGHDHECRMGPDYEPGTYLVTYSHKIRLDGHRIMCEQRWPTELTNRLRPIKNIRTVFYLPDPPTKEDPLGEQHPDGSTAPYVEILWDEEWTHEFCNW